MNAIKFLITLLTLTVVGCGSIETHSSENKVEGGSQASKQDTNQAPGEWPDSLDAVTAAPENHKVVLENDKVRVLDVTVRPGEREALHGHRWPSVLYVMAEDNIRDFDAEGKIIYETKTDKNPMKAPYTIWMEPQAPHAVENLSKEPLRLLRVELKQ